jgi:peptidoglycan/LPS O-acetylase OafA/YrhL
VKNVSRNWLPEIDILRSIGIFVIVICHMDNYIYHKNVIQSFDSYLSFLGLTLFVFISGFSLRYNNNIGSKKDFLMFYKKRLFRIFPLYWISLLSLIVLFGILNISSGLDHRYNFSFVNIFVHIFALQIIFPAYYIQSMWYIGLIALYYILYPFLVLHKKNIQEFLLYSSIFLLPLIFFNLKFDIIDPRVFTYYPVFIGGIIFCDQFYLFTQKKSTKFLYMFSALFLITATLILLNILSIISYENNVLTVLKIIFQLSSIIPCFCVISYIKPKINLSIINITSNIAYGSFSIYLFHHQLLSVLRLMTCILFSDELLFDFFMFFVGIPFTFFMGYLIQKTFSNSSRHFTFLFSKFNSIYLSLLSAGKRLN